MARHVAVTLLAASSPVMAFTGEPSRTVAPALTHLNHYFAGRMRSTSINYAFHSSPNDAESSVDIPAFVVSPVLARVYPALLSHIAKYGNPNIPLGNADGKRCKTLRRLHFQKKLSDEETAHLTELGFRFHSFEDVYYECDFDEMLGKLIDYHDEFQTYQIPKKYDPDPELGAWVTMLRRLHKTSGLPQIQVDKLDAIKFEWISTRRCGSSFMGKYREVLAYLNKIAEARGDVRELVYEDTGIMKWVDAQRVSYENGNMPASRIQYMDDLPGIDWKNPSSWA